MKKILPTLILFVTFATTTVLASDLDIVRNKVNQIQATDPALPSLSEQKGTIGTIIAKIFDGTTGKIESMFLDFGTALSSNDIPRWNGTEFVTGKITDDGTNVGIGTAPNATDKLNINGNLLVTNDVKSSRLCDETGANCFDVSLGWASLASTIWSLNGTKAYYNGGNVGIGTNNPQQSLHTTGNIRADGRRVFFGGNQILAGDDSSNLSFSSNHSTITSFALKDKEGTRYGLLVGSADGENFGLMNGDGKRTFLGQKSGKGAFMYYDGTWRLRTHPSGIQLNGATQIDNVTCIGNCF